MASAAQTGTVDAAGAVLVRTAFSALPRWESMDLEIAWESSAKISHGAPHPISALMAMTTCMHGLHVRDVLKNRIMRNQIDINYAAGFTACAHCERATASGIKFAQ